MKKTARVPSPYGPVAVDLVLCDDGECTSSGQENLIAGWLSITPIGIQLPTMGAVPEEGWEFCSMNCLARFLVSMAGGSVSE